MPDHVRKQIRHAAAALLDGLTLTEDRVYPGRARALPESHEPTLLVYTRVEQSGIPMEGQPGSVGREVQLLVEGRAVGGEELDDLLDDIAAEVEQKLHPDVTFGGLAFDCVLASTRTEVRAEGRRHVGSVRLEYRVRYSTPDEDEL